MGTRVPKEAEVRIRVDTSDGYEVSIIAPNDAGGHRKLENWLKAQLTLIEVFGNEIPGVDS